MGEHLYLKWGTLKGWKIETEASRDAFNRYVDSGRTSMSAILQDDNEAQKAALLDLIDAIDGPIRNDWSGEDYTKEQAKKYIMEYDKK